MDVKKISKICDKISIVLLIAILLLIMYSLYYYGLFIGFATGVYSVGGIEYVCNKTNGTIEDGEYCYIGDVGETNLIKYRHYLNCSWNKIIINSDYHKYPFKDLMAFWFTQCKSVKVELLPNEA